jgi:hypothetical protein
MPEGQLHPTVSPTSNGYLQQPDLGDRLGQPGDVGRILRLAGLEWIGDDLLERELLDCHGWARLFHRAAACRGVSPVTPGAT